MIRRPRSASVAQKSAAVASAPDAKQEDTSGHKRKLSATATGKEDQKKTKTAPEGVNDEEGAVSKVDEEKDDDQDKEKDESDGGDDDKETSEGDSDGTLKVPGPHVCYLWADGISSLLDTEQEMTYVTLKSSVLNAYRKVAHLPEDKREKAVSEYLHLVDTSPIFTTDEARQAPAAKALLEMWEEMGRSEGEEDIDDEASVDGDFQWWYEVTVQKDSPKDDTPRLAVTMDYRSSDVWYLTSIKAADKEGDQAMCTVVNYTAAGYQ